MNVLLRTLLVVAAATLALDAQSQPRIPAGDTLRWPTGTFSILAYDPASGDLGGAVQSRVFSVGNGVLWAESAVGIVAKGNFYSHTGPKASAWAGGKYCAPPHKCTAQGNILAGQGVVDSMVAAFERTPGPLHLRLVAALEGGQRAGGDTHGQQSAAMIIVNVKKNCGVWLHNDVILRLQVDDNPEPIRELRRLAEHRAAQRRDSTCRAR